MDSAAATTAFQDAEAHFAAGRLDQAQVAYRRALEDAGPHPDTLNRLGMVAAQRNDYDQARTMLRQACETDGWKSPAHRQNLVALLSIMGRNRLIAGDDDRAYALLEEAAAHAGEFPELCAQVANDLCVLSSKHLHAQPLKALPPTRAAVRLQPDDAQVRNLWSHAVSYAGARAELADFTDAFTEADLADRPFIACFPKSGSTLLKTLLCTVTGFPDSQLTYAFQQNEEELHLPYALAAARTPGVTQLHCRATEPNLHIMQAFGLRPVVLVRNIFDVLLSYKEFYDAGAYRNTFFRDYPTLDDDTRLDLIVDDRAPWYFAFFASWHSAVERGRIEAHWQTYESLSDDKRGTLAGILDFYGLDIPGTRIDAAVAEADAVKHKTRFNKGQVGRGADAFSARHRERIERLASYYPSVDFSLIGL